MRVLKGKGSFSQLLDTSWMTKVVSDWSCVQVVWELPNFDDLLDNDLVFTHLLYYCYSRWLVFDNALIECRSHQPSSWLWDAKIW